MKKLTLTAIALFSLYGESSLADDLEKNKNSKNYYVDAKSYGTKPESDPPAYVKSLDKTGIEAFKDLTWLDVGLQYRARFEHRDNDFRRSSDVVDDPILSRTRAYFAVKDILDPLRLTFEIQDSRRFHSQFTADDSDVNNPEFVQSYAELYFKNALGSTGGDQRPISIRAGKMAFEVLDRRLVARNEWRNTTNNFQGVRAIFGQNTNDWQVDTFSLQPIVRLPHKRDDVNDNQRFSGVIINWRRWSDLVTLQPFYFRLDQKDSSTSVGRKIHVTGLRGYGVIPNTAFDYDLSGIYQFGNNGVEVHRASAAIAELGYTFTHKWKPRLSENYGYASGDENPTDLKSQRFERLFGFARPWSNNDYFQFENIEAAKTRLEIQPIKDFRFDAGYSLYWIASSSDRWNKANLRDRKGKSGDFIGSEFDFRARYEVNANLDANLGYAYFEPGEFTKNVSRDNPSNFVYLELTWSLF